uniref:CDC20/Fizzy WD40 domain-containing protein n=1 Tax=Entomoneis paludosa TaxID=265537 RepID=A0A7S3DWP5_9STRA|mmetsp:Transcript_6907/g.14407  ORF Transcript_6907/g.14407 Transcript_6907/m.14407 type:complete len:718 (+) Transcript_6907:408-2561(+)|eukprot:CAMPEP_0172461120 /NCGR_PEP_ID=MMETSP1065-20121228/39484_1 /TAXON_ID=265537 /ORGANISM="Amphiprora paludosa, Strain CCMP125" /LENGTH=717 /DNA_ID=CAMNT_0013216343 /DNA_START=306 /DNA_END=2459 /DNA_ORIENTATION=-
MTGTSSDALNMSVDDDQLMQPETNMVHHLSPPDRLALKHASTPATACMSHESSPSVSSRTTETTEMDDSQQACDTEEAHKQQHTTTSGAAAPSSSSTGTNHVWVPMPSPRRPRLDPRYAARLAPTFWSQPSPTSAAAAATSATNTSTAPTTPRGPPAMPDVELTNPPTITRDRSNIFRPTPILTNMDIDVPVVGSTDYANDSFITQPYTPTMSTPRGGPTDHEVLSDVGMSDRFIASRATSNLNMNLWDNASSPRPETQRPTGSSNNANEEGESTNTATSTTAAPAQQNFLNTLLRSELLGENDHSSNALMQPPNAASSSNNNASSRTPHSTRGLNHLRYAGPREAFQENVFADSVGPVSVVNSFSLTPVRSAASQRLMAAPPKRKRRISKVPFKVLDAPALQDDFYLNLVDWSSQNVLAVGLGSCVYLWSACTSKVTKLCDLEATEDAVTSVAWAQRGTHLAVGTNRGEVQLWDTIHSKKVRSMAGHSSRVGALAWTGPVMASGSRDRLIYLRDVRVQASYTDKLTNHKQEVCGLKWSYDEPAFLASGGNDNHLHVIDSRHPCVPIHKFTEHTAAVKAITWSPHQHGLLASGGGTADRCIRFWNTLSGVALNKIDTGSQVCNIAWSRNCNEIVTTHGYSLHQIVVWRYPSMSKVATLTGHTYRVLYLAMSPDGSTVVTGAGDETLRFWQIFPGPRSGEKDGAGGLLFPKTMGSVIR